MNKEKMLEIAQVIEKVEPEKFNMATWFGTLVPAYEMYNYEEDLAHWFQEDDLVSQPIPTSSIERHIVTTKDCVDISCGTTACIAGWAIANEYFNGNKTPFEKFSRQVVGVTDLAREILGLELQQASRLFYCDTYSVWYDHASDYDLEFDPDVSDTWNVHPKHAADVIRRIVSGEIDL